MNKIDGKGNPLVMESYLFIQSRFSNMTYSTSPFMKLCIFVVDSLLLRILIKAKENSSVLN